MQPKITFVLTACEEQNVYYVSIGSLMCQTNPNWECIIMAAGTNYDLDYIFDDTDTYGGVPNIDDKRVKYVTNEKTGFWGHYDRIKSLQLLTTDYVIQSSIQDYFLPNMVQSIYDVLEDNPDMVLWNSMNHLFHDNVILNSEPVRFKADWGNMCVKSNLARLAGINHPEIDICDGLFAEEIAAKSSIIKKINKVLTIHN